jgi:uncharacterized protein YndB with AHSA1/START domain
MNDNNALGEFVDRHTFRLKTWYPYSTGEVWTAITERDALALWFYPMDIEQRVGGKVVLHDSQGGDAEATVTELVPETLLEYHFQRGQSWPEGDFRFELWPEADGCWLAFSQRVMPGHVWRIQPEGQIGGRGTIPPGACAGWHGFFAESLARVLDGDRQRSVAHSAEDQVNWRRRTAQYEQLTREVLLPERT